MGTSKRSQEAPMAFNLVNCDGVLMPEAREPIPMLRLTSVRHRMLHQICY